MLKVLAFLVAVTAAATAATGAGARVQAPSGDTCTYVIGSGGAYTVNVVTGAGTQQYGLAFRAPGLTIKNISISGSNGSLTTSNLPVNASAAWISDAALTGQLSATLTTTGTLSGKIVIVPAASGQSSYFNAVTCSLATGPPSKAVSFIVSRKPSYSTKARGWHLMVRVPIAGIVAAAQPLPASPNVPASLKPKALVQAHRVDAKAAGTVMLTLRPTAAASAKLAAGKALSLKLNVTFDAQDGRAGHKLISLTLHR